MNALIPGLGMKLIKAPISAGEVCYRPPSWPPPENWVVSQDRHGNAVSLWRDPFWDFSSWAGANLKLDFAGGRHSRSAQRLSPANQHILRLLTTWLIWGPRGIKSWASLRLCFAYVRRIVVLCNSEGILASELSRFPQLLSRVGALYANAEERRRTLVVLDRLLRAKDHLGLTVIDESGISQLSASFSADAKYFSEQTAYIPPRIWKYQVLRLRECLDDFVSHQAQIETCFNFCLEAYTHNFGSLEAALAAKPPSSALCPFSMPRDGTGARTGRRYYGHFELSARRFGIDGLLRKWVRPCLKGTIDIKSFSSYLTMVQSAGFAYLINFTLQRSQEAAASRCDCLIWEDDDLLGRIPVIRGDTTKTAPDSDARWPTSPSTERAVAVMSFIARLRMPCAVANPDVDCSDYDKTNPYLYSTAFEPWAPGPGAWKPYGTRPRVSSYQELTRRYPGLFDARELKVTEDDLITARRFTPNLDKGGRFKAGETWPLCFHQLRRTGAINMFASGLLSDSSIQVIMKHLTSLQTRYYGRNYSRLRFSEDYEGLTTAAKYEVLARQIKALVDDRYVSPLGLQRKRDIVINLIGSGDFTALVKAGQNGEVSFRETRLGGCTKRGHCDYGGIESVARCAGGDGDRPCRDAIFDRSKRLSIERQLESVERQLVSVRPGSPRWRALQAEARGLRSYLDVTGN